MQMKPPYQPNEINVLVMYFARALTLINTSTDFVKAVVMAKEVRQATEGEDDASE